MDPGTKMGVAAREADKDVRRCTERLGMEVADHRRLLFDAWYEGLRTGMIRPC